MFALKGNIVSERRTFKKHTQKPCESVLQYVAALRDLTATCEACWMKCFVS